MCEKWNRWNRFQNDVFDFSILIFGLNFVHNVNCKITYNYLSNRDSEFKNVKFINFKVKEYLASVARAVEVVEVGADDRVAFAAPGPVLGWRYWHCAP